VRCVGKGVGDVHSIRLRACVLAGAMTEMKGEWVIGFQYTTICWFCGSVNIL
jgi:hypothetical protein